MVKYVDIKNGMDEFYESLCSLAMCESEDSNNVDMCDFFSPLVKKIWHLRFKQENELFELAKKIISEKRKISLDEAEKLLRSNKAN